MPAAGRPLATPLAADLQRAHTLSQYISLQSDYDIESITRTGTHTRTKEVQDPQKADPAERIHG